MHKSLFVPSALVATTLGLAGCSEGQGPGVPDAASEAGARDGRVDASGAEDASAPEDASGADGDRTNDAAIDGKSNACAWVDARTERVPATVWFVLPYAAYMHVVGDRTTGWDRLESTLFGADGLLPRYQHAIRFGAVFHGDKPDPPICPSLTTVPPALDNAAAIASVPATLGEPSVAHSVHALRYITESPLPSEGEVVVVDVTNTFIPDLACTGGEGDREQAAQDMADAEISLFVQDSPFGGLPEEDELNQFFQTTLSESVSCEFSLNGEVTEGRECEGEVTVDGQPLPCNDPDGWHLLGEDRIELVGEVCETLKTSVDAEIKARFPCEIIEII